MKRMPLIAIISVVAIAGMACFLVPWTPEHAKAAIQSSIVAPTEKEIEAAKNATFNAKEVAIYAHQIRAFMERGEPTQAEKFAEYRAKIEAALSAVDANVDETNAYLAAHDAKVELLDAHHVQAFMARREPSQAENNADYRAQVLGEIDAYQDRAAVESIQGNQLVTQAKADLQGVCNSASVKRLPSGQIAFCSEDAGWKLAARQPAKGVTEKIQQAQHDAVLHPLLAEAQPLDQGKTLSDSKGCMWFVWESNSGLSTTRFLDVDGSQICTSRKAN